MGGGITQANWPGLRWGQVPVLILPLNSSVGLQVPDSLPLGSRLLVEMEVAQWVVTTHQCAQQDSF